MRQRNLALRGKGAGDLNNPKYSLGQLLPDHVAQRTDMLLRHLPQQDLIQLRPHLLPSFLAIDTEIQASREGLQETKRSYMRQDFDEIQNQYQKELHRNLKDCRDTKRKTLDETRIKLEKDDYKI